MGSNYHQNAIDGFLNDFDNKKRQKKALSNVRNALLEIGFFGDRLVAKEFGGFDSQGNQEKGSGFAYFENDKGYAIAVDLQNNNVVRFGDKEGMKKSVITLENVDNKENLKNNLGVFKYLSDRKYDRFQDSQSSHEKPKKEFKNNEAEKKVSFSEDPEVLLFEADEPEKSASVTGLRRAEVLADSYDWKESVARLKEDDEYQNYKEQQLPKFAETKDAGTEKPVLKSALRTPKFYPPEDPDQQPKEKDFATPGAWSRWLASRDPGDKSGPSR